MPRITATQRRARADLKTASAVSTPNPANLTRKLFRIKQELLSMADDIDAALKRIQSEAST